MKIEGIETVLQRIENIADTAPIVQAMGKCCALVEGTVKETAPKGKTGNLRNSTQSKVENNGFEIVGVIFNPLEYAPYVEYGTGLFAENGQGRKTGWAYEDEETGETIWTRGQKPQPFLRPALADNREKISKILKESVKW